MSFLLNHKAKKSARGNNGGNPLSSRFARKTKQQVSFGRKGGGGGGQVQVQDKRSIQTNQKQTIQQRQTTEQRQGLSMDEGRRENSNAIDDDHKVRPFLTLLSSRSLFYPFNKVANDLLILQRTQQKEQTKEQQVPGAINMEEGKAGEFYCDR